MIEEKPLSGDEIWFQVKFTKFNPGDADEIVGPADGFP